MKILDRLPYSADATLVTAPGASVRVKPYQIVVTVSISLRALPNGTRACRALPPSSTQETTTTSPSAEGHLLRWAGLQPEALRIIGAIRERQQRIPLHAASVWLHRNRPGERAMGDQEPHPLKLQQGIADYPDDIGPRLPVLGLRAVTQN